MDAILIISSDTANIKTLKHVLSTTSEVIVVSSVDEALQLDFTHYDLRVILIDAEAIPDWQEACSQLKQAEDKSIILLVVPQISEAVLNQMQDVDDYIDISADPVVICYRVQQAFRLADLKVRNAHLDAFAGQVAHDLQNPLATILGYASTLRTYYKRLSEDEVRESMDYIIECTDQMSNTIDSMLTLARVDNDNELDITRVHMYEVVEQVVLRLSELIRENQARLKFPDEWYPVMGYKPWVTEVLANYVSNAIKYGGTPPIIELGSEYLPSGMVRIWVKDNGKGINTADQKRIFSPFERASTGEKGTGLGLAIAQRIVKRLGGSVGINSSPQGSTFEFTLPAPAPKNVSLAHPPLPESHQTRPGQAAK